MKPAPANPPLDPRVLALLVLTLGVVGMGINEWMSQGKGEVYLIAVLACPAMVLMGLAGLWEPRVLWSLGRDRTDSPGWVRGLGIVLLVLGLACSGWLAVIRYPLIPLG